MKFISNLAFIGNEFYDVFFLINLAILHAFKWLLTMLLND